MQSQVISKARSYNHCRQIDLLASKTGLNKKDQSKKEANGKREIFCLNCFSRITLHKYIINKQGKHLHTVFNPAGILFEIRCFARADGCLPHGDVSETFSWFAGYGWQYVICSGCLLHVGWLFTSPDDYFFALIKNKIT